MSLTDKFMAMLILGNRFAAKYHYRCQRKDLGVLDSYTVKNELPEL